MSENQIEMNRRPVGAAWEAEHDERTGDGEDETEDSQLEVSGPLHQVVCLAFQRLEGFSLDGVRVVGLGKFDDFRLCRLPRVHALFQAEAPNQVQAQDQK